MQATKDLLITLETIIREKRPKVGNALRPGLPEKFVRAVLDESTLQGNIGCAVALYSWKDGADAAKAQESFFPDSIYQFLSLEMAVDHRARIQKAVRALEAFGTPIKMPMDAGRYLPIFWDGVTGYLAIVLTSGTHNRVIQIEFESVEPFREICQSLDEFLSEATRAIRDNASPSVLMP